MIGSKSIQQLYSNQFYVYVCGRVNTYIDNVYASDPVPQQKNCAIKKKKTRLIFYGNIPDMCMHHTLHLTLVISNGLYLNFSASLYVIIYIFMDQLGKFLLAMALNKSLIA